MMIKRVLNKSQQGKKNRRVGAEFEREVRRILERTGWIVSKWQNNVDLETRQIVPAKSNRFLMRSCGFPDFVCIGKIANNDSPWVCFRSVLLVECKRNGILSKEELEKISILKENGLSVTLVCWDEEKREVRFKEI